MPNAPKKKTPKCLFICRQRIDSYGISIGLVNSAQFIVNALNANGIEAKLVIVTDNNKIDKEIVAFQPTHCIIEAIWVVPSKFDILCPLHPEVQFIVRVHSKIPFLAQEGIAIEWIRDYANTEKKFSNFRISANNADLQMDLTDVLGMNSVFLPNIYMPLNASPVPPMPDVPDLDCDPSRDAVPEKFVDIGCFGAMRILKNQLIQAFAAMKFANKIGRRLRFHVNANRAEGPSADTILKNLDALFAGTKHELVGHPWLPHTDFIALVKTMDVGMQVSLTESFNIVIADFVANKVPVVASPDVDWLSSISQAEPTDTDDIVNKLRRAWRGRLFDLQEVNYSALQKHNRLATHEWLKFVNS